MGPPPRVPGVAKLPSFFEELAALSARSYQRAVRPLTSRHTTSEVKDCCIQPAVPTEPPHPSSSSVGSDDSLADRRLGAYIYCSLLEFKASLCPTRCGVCRLHPPQPPLHAPIVHRRNGSYHVHCVP